MKVLKEYKFSIVLLTSIFLGAILGITLQEKVMVLKPIGDIFLNLMFTILVPLIFFSVASSISSMKSGKRLEKLMKNMLSIFFITGLIAAIFMLVVVKVVDPAGGVTMELTKPETTEETVIMDQIVKTFTVNDFVGLFSKDNILPLIIFSVIIGFATQMVGEKGRPFASFLSAGSEIMMKVITFVMYLAPIGLGAYFATLAAELGSMLIDSYLKAAIAYFVAAAVYFFVAFTIYAYYSGGSVGVKRFWKNMLTPTVTALGTCSSAASIPANLDASKRMGIPKDIRDTTVSLGSTLHKDGSVMGGVLKMAFVFAVFDIELSGIGMYATVIAVALLVGIVVGAIPSGGMIGELLILSVFSLPPEALPIMVAVAVIIDAPATVLNASGDNAAGMMVSRRVEGKGWLKAQ